MDFNKTVLTTVIKHTFISAIILKLKAADKIDKIYACM